MINKFKGELVYYDTRTMQLHNDALLQYMMFTDPSKLIAMPPTAEDVTRLGQTILGMFKNGDLDRMWIDAVTGEVMAE